MLDQQCDWSECLIDQAIWIGIIIITNYSYAIKEFQIYMCKIELGVSLITKNIFDKTPNTLNDLYIKSKSTAKPIKKKKLLTGQTIKFTNV